MNLETIKSELKGYFINRFEHNGEKVSDTLCRKIGVRFAPSLRIVRTRLSIKV